MDGTHRRRLNRPAMFVTVSLLAVVLCVSAVALALGSSDDGSSVVEADEPQGNPVLETTAATPSTPAPTPSMTIAAERIRFPRDEAEQRVRSASALVPEGSTVTSKLTTAEQVLAVRPEIADPPPDWANDPNRLIWVVFVTGRGYYAQFGHGEIYDWGVLAYDAVTGEPISETAGYFSAESAPFFDDVVDMAP